MALLEQLSQEMPADQPGSVLIKIFCIGHSSVS